MLRNSDRQNLNDARNDGEHSKAIKTKNRSVLFLCWGNICRSPTGEAVLRKYLEKKNLHKIFDVDSAGVCIDDKPFRPTLALRRATKKRGYRLKFDPRLVHRTDLIKHDLVIASDENVVKELRNVNAAPESQIRLVSEYLPPNWPHNVPDPMHGSSKVCNKVIDMLELACPAIVEELWACRQF